MLRKVLAEEFFEIFFTAEVSPNNVFSGVPPLFASS